MAAHVSSSTIVAEAVSGSHVIKIDGYSRIKEQIENGKYVSSIPFSVGGNNWIIEFFPNGIDKETEDYLSFYLFLDSACAKDVKATVSFELLDKNGGPVTLNSRTSPINTFERKGCGCGFSDFMKKTYLERSAHLRDDSFNIKCEVTVMKEICSKETNKGKQFVVVPPGDLHQHLGNLLVNMDGADVTFDVGQERFLAHRCVLAARSSVFKAEFFGATNNVIAHRTIKIEDMEAGVFRSLLHFIYTDMLPDASQDVVMVQHLLVAADRYNVERLKLICEEKLSKNLDSDMLATNLALAEHHGCHGLKEACFEVLAYPSNLARVMASDGYEHLPPEMKALGVVLAPARLDGNATDDEKSLKGRKRMRIQE
ncbi:hypothetical protein GUJ93_ZPchr0013g33823 [Zizania palustris]|uniref:Speckle-type POZ protein n=1 Tax=Zizania palustris TaxID=103762 RepID=A0A8J6C543_ZIZPA|nr:hypothetical protein GUJ93_ZPchr0013g33823 [Zizania palustris]